MIEQVAVIGGTHGNECTGVHLIQHWRRHPDQLKRASFSPQLLIGNPEAVVQNRRFVDKDLNRCFSVEDIGGGPSELLEVRRARELHEVLGPEDEHAKCDFIIDMHTSTSNCGAMLIFTQLTDFNLRLAAFLKQKIGAAQVVYFPQLGGDSPYMGSLCQRAIGIEVGPVAQGVLRHETIELTESLVHLSLDFAEMCNTDTVGALPDSVDIYRFKSSMMYPEIDGEISAVIHRDLQDCDYKPLRRGQPMFYDFDGRTITYEGEQGLCPVFINEAAYYSDRAAIALTERVSVKVPSVSD